MFVKQMEEIMNGQNNKMDKIKKSSNVAMLIARIGKIFMIMMTVITFMCGVGMIVLYHFGGGQVRQAIEATEATADLEMNIGVFGFNVGVWFTDILNTSSMGWGNIIGAYFIVMCIPLIIFAVTLHFVAKTFKEIRDSDSPFRPTILKNLSLPFILITLMSASGSLFFGAVVGIALWCVYCILDYGCELQKQSDETL